jgi:hypothetical protein
VVVVVVVAVLEVVDVDVDVDGDVVVEVFDAGRPGAGAIARLAAGPPAACGAVGRGVVVLLPTGVVGVIDGLSTWALGAVACSASPA